MRLRLGLLMRRVVLKEAVVKIRGKVVAVIPFRDEYSLKRILEGVKAIRK
jgi:hypothetical protein